VTRSNVNAYVVELKERKVSSVTSWNCIYKLRRASQLLDPKRDFGWLIKIENEAALVIGGDWRPALFNRRDNLHDISLANLMDASASSGSCHLPAKQPGNLGPRAVLRQTLVDEGPQQNFDAIFYRPAFLLALLGRRIATLEPWSEYLLCSHAGLMKGHLTIPPNGVLAQL
jgi:hypothetical protein